MTTDRLVSELARDATLAQRVEQELQRLIVESRLGPGERLPSERELATQFGVSRTVVREAVRALAAKQLVDVSVGRGTVVRAPSPQSAAESMKLLLLMQSDSTEVDKVGEVRHIVENEIAALAAERRTAEDLQRLAAILEENRQHLDDAEVYIKSDVAFHAALARATQNELFVMILDSLVEIMIEVRLLSLRVPGITRQALSYHERIHEAVVAGDAEAARAAMDAHMDQVSDALRQAVGGDPGVSLLAIDIGSSRIKALLADWEGQVHEVRSAATPSQSLEPGERSYPLESVRESVEGLIAGLAVMRPGDRVDTLVFSCLGTAMAPLDADGRPLGPALAPSDARPLRAPWLVDDLVLDTSDLARRTGSDPAAASFLLHALWWGRTHPRVLERTHRFRSPRGYILAGLCDADAEDRAWASRTMLADLETGAWDPEIVAAAGLSADVLPATAPTTSTFLLRSDAIERLGLAPGATAVLGAMDNGCSLLGADGPDRSGLVDIVGTYEHMAGVADLADARLMAERAGALIHAHALPDSFIALSRVPLGELLALVTTGVSAGLDEMLDQLEPEPQGVRMPLTADAVETALRTGSPRREVLQALIESATAVLHRFVGAWADLGRPTDPVAVVGGGSRRETVLRIKARQLGRRLVTLASQEGAGLGALRLAAVAVHGATPAEACALFANPIAHTIEPEMSALRSSPRRVLP